MKYRHGTCTSCGSRFRVPASFQADRAKCKSCGGVVEIGPVDDADTPEQAAPQAGQAAPKATPPAAKPVPARPVAARPAAEKAPARPAAPAARGDAAKGDSVRAAAEAAAERVRTAGRTGKAAGAAGAAGATAAAGSRRGAAAGKTRAERGAGGRRHAAPKKQRSYGPMIGAFVVLVAIGGAAAWFFSQQGEETPAPAEETATAPAEVPAGTTPEPEASEPAAEETAPAAEPEAAPDEQPAEEQPAEAPPPDPDELDLMAFPDEDKLPGTSDEDWKQIQEWMATYIDPSAGAAGNRARAKLMERGREAFPAILNAFKRIDFGSEEGMREGDLTQRLLTDICNGQNFDWRFSTEPGDVLFNKKVVRSWIKAWEQGREFPQAWAKLTKTELADAEKLFETTGPFGTEGGAPVRADSLDDF